MDRLVALSKQSTILPQLLPFAHNDMFSLVLYLVGHFKLRTLQPNVLFPSQLGYFSSLKAGEVSIGPMYIHFGLVLKKSVSVI